MNENTIGGGVKSAVGTAQSKVGAMLGDPSVEAKGDAHKAEGKTQDLIGTVQDAVSQAAEKVSTTAAKVGDQARDVYGQATDRVQKVAEHVDPFVQEQPYVALGLAAAVGLLLGLLIAGRGPKIVYIRPPS